MRKFLVIAAAVGLVVGCNRAKEEANEAAGASAKPTVDSENIVTEKNSKDFASSDLGSGGDGRDPGRRSTGAPAAANNDISGDDKDREILQSIRKSIVIEPGKDEHSVAARNIQIDVRQGVVTLSGPVRTEAEKNDIENRVKSVSGVSKIENRLEVKAR
jgi:hypothetical protein